MHVLPEVPMESSPAAVTGSKCVKCGTTKKSGKHSCCARGGTWFKTCGDAGGTNFDHTWAEGIQACKSIISVKSATHAMLATQNVSDSRSTYQQQTNINLPSSVSHIGTTYSKDYAEFMEIVLCISVLFIMSHL